MDFLTYLRVRCDPGYETQGSSYTYCSPDFTWTPPGTCRPVKGCGEPNTPRNAVALVGTSNFGSSRYVQYNGGSGYWIQCQQNGSWTPLRFGR